MDWVSRRRCQGARSALERRICPTLTRGEYAYDFGDTVGLTPLVGYFALWLFWDRPKVTMATDGKN